jgi:hypothetical protein
MAFGNDMTLFVIGRHSIRTVPCTVLASDTAGIVVEDDTVVEFDVAVGGTTDEAGGIDAVVTAHGVKQQKGVREASPLHLADTSPFDVGWVVVLFVTCYFATAASDTGCCIEVETVLFSFFQWRYIY